MIGDKPDWFHEGGCRMEVRTFDPDKNQVVIEDPTGWAKLRIWWISNPNPVRKHIGLTWEISHHFGKTSGSLRATPSEFEDVFNMYGSPEGGIEGLFVRKGHYTNIPGRNYNGDGDPNLSVFADERLIVELKKFYEHNQALPV